VILLAIATLVMPGVLLVAGPVLFGVAHVTGDVRHLVLRRNLPRAWTHVVAVASVVLIALRITELIAPSAFAYARVEVFAGWAWVAGGVTLGALFARSVARGLLVGAPVAFLMVVSIHAPTLTRLLLAYVHNLIALVIWVVLFRARRLFAAPAIFAAVALAALFASGAPVPWTSWRSVWADRLVGESLAQVGSLVPPRIAVGLGLSFVFLQAIHYSTWVAWIPQDDRRAHGTSTFRMTARALRSELGGAGVALAIVAEVVVLIASSVRVHPTRAVYMSVSAFHGWLELAAIAFFAARGRVSAAPVRAAAP
jgi:hypothetical protein